MSPDRIDATVFTPKSDVIHSMLAGIGSLPLETLASLCSDPRMCAAGESSLRRALEALLDLGRDVLAKGLGSDVTDDAGTAAALHEAGVISSSEAERLRKMACYRNRMVHLYDELSLEALYEILTVHVDAVPAKLGALRQGLEAHPERLRGSL